MEQPGGRVAGKALLQGEPSPPLGVQPGQHVEMLHHLAVGAKGMSREHSVGRVHVRQPLRRPGPFGAVGVHDGVAAEAGEEVEDPGGDQTGLARRKGCHGLLRVGQSGFSVSARHARQGEDTFEFPTFGAEFFGLLGGLQGVPEE